MHSLKLFKRRARKTALRLLLFLCLPALLWGCATPGPMALKLEPPPPDLAAPCEEPIQLLRLTETEDVRIGELLVALRQFLFDAGQCARRKDALVKAWPRQ